MNKNKKQQKNNQGDQAFENMLDIVYADMQSRHSDPEVQKIRDIYSEKTINIPNAIKYIASPISGITSIVGSELEKRAKTYPEIYNNFTSGGKWDHKVQGKEILDSYYSKKDTNKDGQSAVVFGGKIPTDNQNVYDHDFWGNLSYGFILRAAGLSEAEIRAAAIADDLINGTKAGKWDLKDDDMVAVGIALYNKYGDKMTKEDLRREIIAHIDALRKYPNDSLEKRSARAKNGDDLAQIAKREGVTVSDIQKQLDKDAQINEKVYGNINDQMSLREGVKVNLPRETERSQNTPVENGKDNPPQAAGEDVKRTDEGKATNGENVVHEKGVESNGTSADKGAKDVNAQSAVNETKEAPLNKLSQVSEAEVSKILKAFQTHDNKAEDIFLKPSLMITPDEIMRAQKAAMYDIKDKKLQQQYNQKITDFYETFYGNENVAYDETGKMIQPQARIPIPQQPKELMTKDNVPINNAFQQLARDVADSGTKALQRGLNILGISPTLKEDGIIGPKTTSKTKEAMIKNGLQTLKSNVGIGAFENMLEGHRKKEIPQDTLKNTVDKIGPSAGRILQKGLNEVGKNKENFEKLKEDNDIGPKTTTVFNQLKDEEEERVKTFFRPAQFALG